MTSPVPELVIDLHAAASSYTGQGVSVRGYLHYLTRRNLAIRLHDMSPGGGRENFDPRFAVLAETPLDAPAPGVWIHVGGGGDLPPWLDQYRAGTQAAGRAAAYHLWWELPVLHPEVVARLDRFDAVIASTHFIAEVARRHLRHARVIHAPQPLIMAEAPRPMPDRAGFGIPDGVFAILFSFDPVSDTRRKNPEGVLQAFRLARQQAPRLHLVVKLMLPRAGRLAPGPAMAEFLEAARLDPGITLIEAALEEAALHRLHVSCDAYISLHRAEGLGLGMLEAMHLGVPVVATGYSGNMSFMDEESACLVPYQTVPLPPVETAAYQAVAAFGPTWAEPDVAAAADHLVRLASDPGYCRQRGEAGARSAAAWQREAEALAWLEPLRALALARQGGGPVDKGDRPPGERQPGERPLGERPLGERPFGARLFGYV